eukprot:c24748_g1_i1 orf=610-3012(-)
MMKRAYKLQEFVAHASNVNCLKIGKKSSRVLVTGGEDHKVNTWAIGKPNAILSLSGHSSAVESVTFDAAELLVVAGAASGTIKLWDLEEAKIVRTLTGHRSNCIAVDFHPFGEIFASGSLDTNLKIWDIRRKGCIYTYKGHTRGVNAIKFSPDGRWVVSGGEDNIVKLWDLTAGKLMHDFKYHDGQILCLDFHPHEFLLATGSADRTVKFWDLETFEPIGSTGPEASGVRSLIFNPDGRTLLSGLHESMKIYSWEPLRCHDVVDVGWSKLADLNVHEGKLLGCSYNQSCVGIWVVDLSCMGSYTTGSNTRTNGITNKLGLNSNQPLQQIIDGSVKSGISMRDTLPNVLESGMKEVKLSTEGVPSTPQRVGSTVSTKVSGPVAPAAPTYMMTPRRTEAARVQPVSIRPSNKFDIVPVVVPRHDTGVETAPVIMRPGIDGSSVKPAISVAPSKASDFMKPDSLKGAAADDTFRSDSNSCTYPTHANQKVSANMEMVNRSPLLPSDISNAGMSAACEDETENIRWIRSGKFRRAASTGAQRDVMSRGMPVLRSFSGERVSSHQELCAEPSITGSIESGQLRSLAATWRRKEKDFGGSIVGMPGVRSSCADMTSSIMKGEQGNAEKCEAFVVDDTGIIEELMEQHTAFSNIMQSRLSKLQVVKHFWIKNDMKGAVEAMGKMADNAVLVDVLSILTDGSDAFTLEICTLLLPLLNGLLGSEFDRYVNTALVILLLLVKNFGNVIHTTRSASPSFGVDLHAEERFERCNACYIELQSVKQKLAPLLRKGGETGKSAQDLSIALQEV